MFPEATTEEDGFFGQEAEELAREVENLTEEMVATGEELDDLEVDSEEEDGDVVVVGEVFTKLFFLANSFILLEDKL